MVNYSITWDPDHSRDSIFPTSTFCTVSYVREGKTIKIMQKNRSGSDWPQHINLIIPPSQQKINDSK
jgi:hypothetical protein